VNTLVITGGAGFIGANLVELALRTTTSPIVVVDKLTYASNRHAVEGILSDERVTFVRADIGDAQAMGEVFLRHRPSAVLNLAAETHVDRSIDSPRAFIETNVVGTFVLLELARQHVRSLARGEAERFRFLHVSTDEVFGTLGPEGRFSESSPYAPNSPYAASKASADHLVRSYFATYHLATLITNCSNNYGPYQHPEKLIPLTILNALEGRRLPIYGNGSNVRDWLHVQDHGAAILRVLQHGVPGESYNIGASNEQSNLALVDQLCAALDDVVPARTNPVMRAAGRTSYAQLKEFVPDRPGHDHRYAVDASKIQRELGWVPTRSFAEGLRTTVQWYVEHRGWFAAATLGYGRERLGLGLERGGRTSG
jgi:dTDP-glucose 4,6-dehydratase